jgi:hypothetical protein
MDAWTLVDETAALSVQDVEVDAQEVPDVPMEAAAQEGPTLQTSPAETAADVSDQPMQEVPPALALSSAVQRDVMTTNAQRVAAVLSVIAPQGESRAPLSLSVVLDRSGSMRGEKIRLVVETMQFLLTQLQEQDSLGIVSYDTNVRVDAPLRRCDEAGKAMLRAALARLRPGSTTNLSGGLLAGLDLHRRGTVKVEPVFDIRQTHANLSAEQAVPSETIEGMMKTHLWSLEVHTLPGAGQGFEIEEVIYHLHESFKQPVVRVTEAPFRIERKGWGYFEVRVEIRATRRVPGEPDVTRTITCPHMLKFDCAACRSLASWEKPAVAPTNSAPSVASTFLFTDGIANCGISDTAQLCEAVRNVLADSGEEAPTLHCFGFGEDHNAEMLRALADVGGGVYSFIKGAEEIATAFGEALGGLLSTSHQNVELVFEPAPGVVPHVRTTYETVPEGQGFLVRLRDLYVEERRDVLVELEVPAGEVEERTVLGHVRARGFSLAANAYQSIGPAAVLVGRAPQASAEDPFVSRHQNRWEATNALEHSRTTANNGDLAAARAELEAAIFNVQNTALARGGDATVLGYVQDMQECVQDLRDRNQYMRVGSKKMAFMGEAHAKQRSVNTAMMSVRGEGCADYSSSVMKSMGARFKGSVH